MSIVPYSCRSLNTMIAISPFFDQEARKFLIPSENPSFEASTFTSLYRLKEDRTRLRYVKYAYLFFSGSSEQREQESQCSSSVSGDLP